MTECVDKEGDMGVHRNGWVDERGCEGVKISREGFVDVCGWVVRICALRVGMSGKVVGRGWYFWDGRRCKRK